MNQRGPFKGRKEGGGDVPFCLARLRVLVPIWSSYPRRPPHSLTPSLCPFLLISVRDCILAAAGTEGGKEGGRGQCSGALFVTVSFRRARSLLSYVTPKSCNSAFTQEEVRIVGRERGVKNVPQFCGIWTQSGTFITSSDLKGENSVSKNALNSSGY